MIKFRVWDKTRNEYLSKEFVETFQFRLFKSDFYIFEQFTGLQDKNGVDIYIGDILKREDGRIGSVVFEDGELILYEEGTSLYWLIERVKNNIEKVFIIGNVNENNFCGSCGQRLKWSDK